MTAFSTKCVGDGLACFPCATCHPAETHKDWVCENCGALNFHTRPACRSCKRERPERPKGEEAT